MASNKPKKLSDEELVALLDQHEQSSRSRTSSRLSRQRAQAMNYYEGAAYGNERPGRSKFVTREVMDTVEWIMPYLMRTFFGSVDAVEFTPRGPDDVDQARQETDYINYLWQQKNDGFRKAYQWIKDGLLQKTGILKVWWEESDEVVETEEYTGLNQEDVDFLATEEELVVLEVEPEEVPTSIMGEPLQGPTFSVKTNRIEKRGRLRVEPVPPEEFSIDRDAKTIQDSAFTQQETQKTISQLREEGFPEHLLTDLSEGDSSNIVGADERLARYRKDDTNPYTTQTNDSAGSTDPSQRQVWVKEAYVRADVDGDGIAELRKVVRVGSTVLENEAAAVVPFAGFTPILMSHKFYGLSIADTVMDLQLLQSTLLRNMLDNQYAANNGRYEVMEGQVNLDDLTTSHPQGYVRVKAPGAIQPLPTPQLGPEAFQLLEYMDVQRERRTGVSALTQGVSPEMLNSHTTATQHTTAMNSAQQKLELLARVLAETGMKDLFRLIHSVVLRHQDKAEVAKVTGGYVQVSPTEWRDRYEMSVNVGIGNLSPEQKMVQMQTIANTLQMAASAGADITDDKSVRTFIDDMVRLTNPAAVGRYTSEPKPPEPPPPDPQMEKAKMDAQIKQQELQLKQQELQMQQQREQAKLALDQKKFALEQEQQAFEEQKFEWQQQKDAAELKLEEDQQRAASIGDGG